MHFEISCAIMSVEIDRSSPTWKEFFKIARAESGYRPKNKHLVLASRITWWVGMICLIVLLILSALRVVLEGMTYARVSLR